MASERTDYDACKKRVLVIEDELSITSVCRRVLAREGLEVDSAQNGKEAQDMISQKEYDFFLIDIRTPTMDGKEFYYWLKRESPLSAVKAVFMTGDAMGGDTQSFLKETGQPFLLKPFTTSELIAFIRKVFAD
jgi:CheY-like chemotaxis protein